MKTTRWVAMVFLSIVAIAALAPEVWAPARYDTQFRDSPDARPSSQFPLGTDALGRDRLSRLMYGTRVSLLLAPAAALLSCLVAGELGGLAGLAAGVVDPAMLAAAGLFLFGSLLLLVLIVRAVLALDGGPPLFLSITVLLPG